MTTVKHLLSATVALLAVASSPCAQTLMVEKVCQSNYHLDAEKQGELSVEVDNMTFFKDNEFDGTTVISGYTLPGLWIQPKLTYQPLGNIKLELGCHALIYDGAYKFPSYAYHDISVWKGSQYQKGAHVLPYFRGQVALNRLQLVFGDIYGGSNHQLIEPMYNPELTLTADPEAGFQFIYDAPAWHLDTWLNWQSFIFKQDSHQEAFTVGISSRVRLNKENSAVHCYIPTQITIQHRGGEELEERDYQVQTLMNGAVGVGVDWNLKRKLLKKVNVEVDGLAYYQQSGDLWPFDSGTALYANATLNFGDLNVGAGYFYCHNFISLFGSAFFGSASIKDEGAVYRNPSTALLSVDYSKNFGKHYAVGARAELYNSFACTMTNSDGEVLRASNNANFSFGVYLRANPTFLIKKFKKGGSE
jgi:hypothetical protein